MQMRRTKKAARWVAEPRTRQTAFHDSAVKTPRGDAVGYDRRSVRSGSSLDSGVPGL